MDDIHGMSYNSLRYCDTCHCHHWFRYWFGTYLVTGCYLSHVVCQLDPWQQTPVEFKFKCKDFSVEKKHLNVFVIYLVIFMFCCV